MHNANIAIIGAGNMGGAIAIGLIKNGYRARQIWVSDADFHKLTTLKQKIDLNITTDNKEAVLTCQVIVLAVKPQILMKVIKEINQFLSHQPLIISVAAGITTAQLAKWLNGYNQIIRAMPNTPALIGCGATALYANVDIDASSRDIGEMIFRSTGITNWVKSEHLLDVVTALSGSGPAYFYYLMEILQHCAIQAGLPEEVAHSLIVQTALGSARLALESNQSLAELRANVTSPHGTTAAAISALENHHFQTIIHDAFQAGKKRAEELAQIKESE